jgi:hypothetical protein
MSKWTEERHEEARQYIARHGGSRRRATVRTWVPMLEEALKEIEQLTKEKSAALRAYGKYTPEDKKDEAWQEYLELAELRQVGASK